MTALSLTVVGVGGLPVSGMAASPLLWLSEDALSEIIGALDIYDVVSLSTSCHSLRQHLLAPIEALRAALPPPYHPAALDTALAAGDLAQAMPLLGQAMKRLRHNVSILCERLRGRGYPLAETCARSGQRLMEEVHDIDDLLTPFTERGMAVPATLRALWQELGGIVLASPSDAAHVTWWSDMLPGVHPDPLWIDHVAGVVEVSSADDEYTYPSGFSVEEGFVFKTAPVLHIAPDRLSKQFAHSSPNAELGSYAVWLETTPSLDPELVRFTPPDGWPWASPPAAGSSDGVSSSSDNTPPPNATALTSCSLIRYLRLAVLEAGGFPGALGCAAFEPLRRELTEGLQVF